MLVASFKLSSEPYHLLAELLFDRCFRCFLSQIRPEVMSAIPQGVFAANKVSASLAANGHSRRENLNDGPFYEQTCTELSPLKYNSKLMNSIWGLYNRYSVHNFKKNTDAELVGQTRQDATGKASRPSSPGRISTEWLSHWPPAHTY